MREPVDLRILNSSIDRRSIVARNADRHCRNRPLYNNRLKTLSDLQPIPIYLRDRSIAWSVDQNGFQASLTSGVNFSNIVAQE